MLREAGARAVILGHSERRADHGEADALVHAKVEAARDAGLEVIVCVGETLAQRDSGAALETVRAQLAGSLPDGCTPAGPPWSPNEPVWAIGTGRVAEPAQIEEVHAALRAALAARFDGGAEIALLYGGSVKAANAAEIFAVGDVDGALVGGASLTAADFPAHRRSPGGQVTGAPLRLRRLRHALRRRGRGAGRGGRARRRSPRRGLARAWPSTGGTGNSSTPGSAASRATMPTSPGSRPTRSIGRLERMELGDDALRTRLLSLYDRLPAYPEAAAALGALRAAGHRVAILSNGTPAMLAAAVEASGLGPFDAVISAEEGGNLQGEPGSVRSRRSSSRGPSSGHDLRVLQRLGRGWRGRLRLPTRSG